MNYGIAPAGYRLPVETRLGEVTLQVADLERSVDFYERVLGLRLLMRDGDAALLGAANGEPLIALRERAGALPVPRQGRLGLYHFAILLPDRPALGRFLAHLQEHGVRVGAADHLVSEALYLRDPDGLGIEVYADRPRELWRSAERELLMASEPLARDEVIASAASERWAGAPSGTRMGHVHLHVGDLAKASAFYHDALGFDAVVWSYPGALFLSAGGYHHHLGTNTWAAGAPPARDDEARLLEWTIILPAQDDVEAAALSVEGAGNATERDGRDLIAFDPWGTKVRLQAR